MHTHVHMHMHMHMHIHSTCMHTDGRWDARMDGGMDAQTNGGLLTGHGELGRKTHAQNKTLAQILKRQCPII